MKEEESLTVKKSWAFTAFFLLGFLAYQNVFSHPFVHDDFVFIVQNPHIQSFDLKHIFRHTAMGGDGSSIINTYYRPLLEIVYRCLYAVFGTNPAGYHIFNIFLHVINAFLVFLCLQNMKWMRDVTALAVSMVFLLHPVQTEAVACISGISNLCVGLFFFGAFYLFLQWQDQKKNRKFLLSSLVLVFAGLFAKEQMVVVPVLFGFYEWILGARKEAWKTGLIYFVPVGLYLGLRRFVLHLSLPSIFEHPAELVMRLQSIPVTLLTDVQLLFFPIHLHYYRSMDILAPMLLPAFLFLLLVAGLVLMGRSLEKKHAALFWFGLGWFIITLLPMLNILPLIQEYSFILTFEHFLYIPMTGFVLSISVWVYAHVRNPPFLQWVLVILCGVYFLITLQQNLYWRGEVPLFERALQFESSGRLHHLLGRAYYFEKRYDEAKRQIKRGIIIFEGYKDKVKNEGAREFYLNYLGDMYFDLGNLYLETKDFLQAEHAFESALDMNPHHPHALNNLAFVYVQSGKNEKIPLLLENKAGLGK